MCIHQDRTAHLYIGLAMVIIALIGLNQDWLGELGRLLFLGILSLGAAWALLLGGLAPLIIMLLVMPFFFVGHVLFLPVKKRGDKIYHQDNPVVASKNAHASVVARPVPSMLASFSLMIRANCSSTIDSPTISDQIRLPGFAMNLMCAFSMLR